MDLKIKNVDSYDILGQSVLAEIKLIEQIPTILDEPEVYEALNIVAANYVDKEILLEFGSREKPAQGFYQYGAGRPVPKAVRTPEDEIKDAIATLMKYSSGNNQMGIMGFGYVG